MDKWKELELQKMKVGGNKKAKDFFDTQEDWVWKAAMNDRYNSKAAALYRDKISTEAQGKPWSLETSTANNFVSRSIPKSATTGQLSTKSPSSSRSTSNTTTSTIREESEWAASSYQSSTLDMDQVKSHKEDFFSRRQSENATRPGSVQCSVCTL